MSTTDPPAADATEPAVIQGIDISYAQPHVDWPAVAASGIRFVIAKASQRKVDPMFASHWNGARAVGLKVGLYHYIDASMPVSEQIDLFLDTYRSVDGFADLPPALDIEEAQRGETPEHLVGRALSWIWAVEAELGVKPMLYTGPAFAEEHMRCPQALDFAACPLWLAHSTAPGKPPRVPEPWSSWSIWQHTDKGHVEGIRGEVDLDRLRPAALGLAWNDESG